MTDIRCRQCSEAFPRHVVAQFGGSCPACVAGFAEVPEEGPLKAGATFGRYVVGERLGKGGMGVVYRARQSGLDRDVALKVLSPRFAADVDFVRRFEREAKTLAALNHPNIVAVYDTGIESGTPYLAMELIEGVSLRTLLSERRLPPEEALGIVPQLCDALEYAHEKGVVHRDIKPENILIDTRGRVKVADYGLAVMTGIDDARLTQTRSVMGTPHYMAPEQVENTRAVDHRADIYSMGVVFYEMLTGELPLGHFSMPSAKAKVSRRLDEIVVRALAKEPERRYQRASEVKSDLVAAPRGPGKPRRSDGFEWRTEASLFGLPLIHVAMRRKGGRIGVAKGIIAVGDVALGILAFGGVAFGGLAFGGLTVGLLSFGGVALAVLAALGGLAVGGYSALGGAAIAGQYAAGGSAQAPYVVSPQRSDEEAERFFASWGNGQARARYEKRRLIREVNYHYLDPDAKWTAAVKEGDVDTLKSLLEGIPKDSRDYVRALKEIGFDVLASRWSRPAEGLPYLHRALAARPEDLSIWEAVQAACRLASCPVESAPPSLDPYQDGLAAYEAGRHAKAWALLIRTPRTSPHFAKAYRFVGYDIFTREWNRPLEGIPYLDAAYEAAPDDPNVVRDIIRAYDTAGLRFER